MGRRKKTKKRSQHIGFRVTPEEKDILRIIADHAGMDLSDLLRAWVLLLVLRFKMGLPITLPDFGGLNESDVSLSEERDD